MFVTPIICSKDVCKEVIALRGSFQNDLTSIYAMFEKKATENTKRLPQQEQCEF